jgi:hypothetical protein
MPISTNYGSTGRPPGEYHLRHYLKELTSILEFLHPPFDIIYNRNNNIYSICYDDNGNVDIIYDDNGDDDTSNIDKENNKDGGAVRIWYSIINCGTEY